MKRHLAALGLLAALCVALLWPLPLSDAALGHPLSDLADHYWGAWWWGSELLAGRLPMHTTISHLPAGQQLWYVDPMGAALALVFRPFGYVAAYNLALLAELLLAAGAMYALAWRLLRKRRAALLAGAALVSAPFLLGLLHSGLNEYLGLVFPVLLLGAALAAAEGRPRAWLPAGLAVALCTAQAFYYGAFACLLLLCLALGPQPLRRAKGLGLALLAGILLAAPLLWSAGSTVFGGHGAVSAQNAPGWQQLMLPATDLSLFLRPGPHYFPDTPALGNPGILHVHYLGWVVLLLAVQGFRRHPRLRSHRWSALLFGICALGPAAAWQGRVLSWGEGALPLPLALLYWLPGSPWALVHHPYRLTAFLVPLLALGAAAAISRQPRWVAAVALPALLMEALFISPAVWPLPTLDVRPPAIYEQLPEPGGVLDWPPDATTWNRRYEVWQVSHGRPIPYGVNAFLSEPIMVDPLVAELLGSLEDPRARLRNRDVPREPDFPPADPSDVSRLDQLGIRYLVVHPAACSVGELEVASRIAERWLGEPVLTSDEGLVWRVGR